MRNKILFVLIFLILLVGIYFTLYGMYALEETLEFSKSNDTSNVGYSSYIFLLAAILVSILMLFFKDVSLVFRRIIFTLAGTFYFFSWTLALIVLYASPNNQIEFKAGTIFFLAGSFVLGASFFVKSKKIKVHKSQKIGTFHKVVRYIFVLIIGLIVLRAISSLLGILPFFMGWVDS